MNHAKKRIVITVLTMGLFSFPAKAEPLAVGSPAPEISAVDQDGAKVILADVYARGVTLVYFYPKADTPGCTAQACSLRDSFADLHAEGLQILGVSHDTQESQKKFQAKYKLPFTLLSDNDGKIAQAFGVPTVLGFTSRQSFLIKNGKIVWNSLKAKTSEHAAEVQAALDSLK
jgi:peroxiredoxin Q/BCP